MEECPTADQDSEINMGCVLYMASDLILTDLCCMYIHAVCKLFYAENE